MSRQASHDSSSSECLWVLTYSLSCIQINNKPGLPRTVRSHEHSVSACLWVLVVDHDLFYLFVLVAGATSTKRCRPLFLWRKSAAPPGDRCRVLYDRQSIIPGLCISKLLLQCPQDSLEHSLNTLIAIYRGQLMLDTVIIKKLNGLLKENV